MGGVTIIGISRYTDNSLKQLTPADSPWAYIREGLFSEGLIIGILGYMNCKYAFRLFPEIASLGIA